MPVVIATKTLRKGMLFNFINGGGSLRFKEFNLGLAISGEGEYRELKLIVIPQNEQFTGKIVVQPRKKKQESLKTEEDTEEEL